MNNRLWLRRLLPIVVLGGALLAYNKLHQTTPSVERQNAPPVTRLLVDTQLLQPTSFQVEVSSYGVVQPRIQGRLIAEVGGRIVRLAPEFRNGGFFEKGEVLVSLDPLDYEVRLQVAESAVVEAELALEEELARGRQAEADWKKIQQRNQASALALRHPQRKAAEAQLKAAKANLRQAQADLERTRVRAPFRGRVLNTQVEYGEVVTPQGLLAEIYASDAAEIRLPLNTQDIPYLRLPETSQTSVTQGIETVTLLNKLVHPPEQWQATLVRTESSIDAASQRLYVIAAIEDPFAIDHAEHRPLRVGQYMPASIAGRTLENVIVVPNASVYQGSYVFVVEGNILLRREIVPLWRNDRFTVVADGLQAGEELVLTSLGQVSSGTQVERRQEEDAESVEMANEKNSPGDRLAPL